MKNFLPYYEEIKLVGHAGCAYAASILGALGLLTARQFGGTRVSFNFALSFSVIASGALWILPFLRIFNREYSEYISLGILLAFLPILKMCASSMWKGAFILWFSYALAQSALFAIIYYYVL